MENIKLSKAKLRKLIKKSENKQFKEWAISVKERDGNKCVICGSNKLLNSHHIITRCNKELRFDINNGVTLCVLHHQFSREISAHKNSLIFIIWLMKNRKEQYDYLAYKIEQMSFLYNKNGRK